MESQDELISKLYYLFSNVSHPLEGTFYLFVLALINASFPIRLSLARDSNRCSTDIYASPNDCFKTFQPAGWNATQVSVGIERFKKVYRQISF